MRIFSTDDHTHNQFMEAGLEYMEQIFKVKPLPIYKYFPTRAYKKFIQAASRMRELGNGVFLSIY